MSFLAELKRRNVLRVGAAYIVTAWLVVQVVETLFPVYGLSDDAIRLVVNILAIGLVPVLVLAWVFEWTPEGIKRDAEVDGGSPSAEAAAKRLDRIILAVLALALGYFAFDKFVLDPARDVELAETARQEGRSEAIVESYGDASIAVLAFADMSPGKDQEYLSDGLAEEILHLLEKVEGLRVISRTSAFSYKGKDTPIPTIAEQLNVAHVLEGSVRKAGDRIRVTAQLIEARSDTHMWSQTFDRTLDDIFAIQDELAAAMVEQLQIELLGEIPTQQRINPEAYVLWLEGHHLASYVDPQKAILILERVVELEPGFADAWADLARAYYQTSPTVRLEDHEGDPAWSKARAAEAQLVQIEVNHPWLQLVRGWDAMLDEADFAKSAEIFEQALANSPKNWDLNRGAAMLARMLYRDDLSLSLIRPFLEKDPMCPDCSYQYSRSALAAEYYDLALAEIRRFKRLVPRRGGEITLVTSLVLSGQIEEAREVVTQYQQGASLNQDNLEWHSRGRFLDLLVRLHEGEPGDMEAEIAALEQLLQPGISMTRYDIVELYALAGLHERAFEILETEFNEMNTVQAIGAARSPLIHPLKDDPRWFALLESKGVAPSQLAEIEFNPPLPRLGTE